MSDAKVTVGADLSDFKHEFALANQFAEERLKATRTAAKRELGGAGGEVQKFGKQFAELAGGPATQAVKVLELAGGTLGAAGVAAGAAAIGIVAVASAWVGVAEAAVAAEKRLEKAGLASMIDPAARAAVEELASAQDQLALAADRATVEVGGAFAPAVAESASVLTAMVSRIDSTIESLRVVPDTVMPVLFALQKLTLAGWAAEGAWLALSQVWGKNVEEGQRIAETQKNVAEGEKTAQAWGERSVKMMEERAKAEAELEAERKRSSEREAAQQTRQAAAAHQAAAAALREHMAALSAELQQLGARMTASAALRAAVRAEADDQLSADARVQAATEERIQGYRELLTASGDLEAFNAAVGAAEERRDRELHALRLERHRELQELMVQAAEAEAEADRIRADRLAELLSQAAAGAGAIGSALDSVTELSQASAAAMAENARDGSATAKRQALAAFERTKALQLAAAAVEAIRAGISMIPSFSYLGPGAPAAAAAAAGLAFGTAVTQIQAVEPPSFQEGGLVADRRNTTPDHRVIAARDDEGILTGRGVRAAGGRDGIDRLNRGEVAHGGEVRVGLYVGRKQLAEVMVDPMDSVRRGAPIPGRRRNRRR